MSPVSEVSSSTIQADYMKLMIEQLRNQNPLEPMNNNEMASQLALFSQLQQLESMNSNFADVLSATNRNYANSLIGKNVSYFLVNQLQGYWERNTDMVDEVYHNVDGETILMVGKRNVGLEDIANSLIGKKVSFKAMSKYGTMEIVSGTVQQYYEEDGVPMLVVGTHKVGLEDVADSLVGMDVSYQTISDTGAIETRNGVIQGISNTDGQLGLTVATPINVDEVISIKNSI